jgi:hypothetical protein
MKEIQGGIDDINARYNTRMEAYAIRMPDMKELYEFFLYAKGG